MPGFRPALRRLVAIAAVLTVGLAACSGKPDHPAGSSTPTVPASGTATTGPATLSPTAVASLQGRAASLSLPVARYAAAGATIGRDLYVLGGLDATGLPSSDVERVDPATSKVTLAGHLSTPTDGASAVASGGKILVFGGAARSGGAPLGLVQVFDPATGTTAQAGTLAPPRTEAAATQVGNEIIVVGGFDGALPVPGILATADGSSFHAVGRLKTPVWAPAVAVVGTTVYVFGGVVSGSDYIGTFSASVQSYNISTGLSKVVGTLPDRLAHARAVTVGDQVFVLGGWTPSGPSAAIQRFDPRTGALTPAGNLPGPVADPAAGTIGTTTYLAGGIAAQPLAGIATVSPRSAP
ncbi:MAG TPA: kelch repeat-containing protein [Actinomycetota bacterium]